MIEVTTDPDKIDLALLQVFLNEQSYWARERPRATVLKSVENSRCYSLLLDGAFIGFARIVTDYATFAYLCDVLVAEGHRGRGYGQVLIRHINDDPVLAGVKVYLLTRDAHSFYAMNGFVHDEALGKKLMFREPGRSRSSGPVGKE